MRLRVPRPQHGEADPDDGEAWKKNEREQVEKIQVEHPNAAVEVWSGAGDAPPPVKTSIGLGYTQLCGASGSNKENKESQKSIGSGSGCGYMHLFNLKPDKPKAWILKRSRRTEDSARRTRAPMLIRGCSVGYSKTKAAHFGVGQDKRVVLPLDQAGWQKAGEIGSARRHPLSVAATLFT